MPPGFTASRGAAFNVSGMAAIVEFDHVNFGYHAAPETLVDVTLSIGLAALGCLFMAYFLRMLRVRLSRR